ncbi:MAG: NAD-glutamate dehydrogenase [Proteobacteria bacterium]|nr:NAD-glutamate dehydrogenase [Pseudomonadota bacterium]
MTPKAALAGNHAGAAQPFYEDEAKAQECIAAAAALVETREPELAAFLDALYRDAPPEDVTGYTPASLAALARLTFEKSALRKPGETLVAVFPFDAEGKGSPRQQAVLLAVNDDMPFLFDSLIGAVTAEGAHIRALFHPVIAVTRGGDGARGAKGAIGRESVIVAVLDPIPEEQRRNALADGARATFTQVRLAVRDWRKMVAHLKETVSVLQQNPPQISREEQTESVAFLEWLGDNHFTFLGCRDYAYSEEEGGRLEPLAETGLGVLSDPEARVIRRGENRAQLTPEVRAFLKEPHPLIITKSNERSLIHRRVHMDYIGVKLFDTKGKLKGERRFVGLFTSGAYWRRPSDIPLLRLKVKHVRERANLAPDSHDGKALTHILDSFPRDELFQVTEDELFATAIGILRVGERPKVRVFLRFDQFDRFVSALVFVPRDRYDTEVREHIHAILAKAFNGRMSAATPTIDDSALARVHYIVGRREGLRPHVDVHVLEDQIRAAIRTWEDGFRDALVTAKGPVEGARLFSRHAQAFPVRYRDVFTPDEAVRDLEELDELVRSLESTKIAARAYRNRTDAHSALRLKLYVLGNVLPLSASLPVFENLGFRVIAEDSYPVTLAMNEGWSGEAAILDFLMERADDGAAELPEIKERLEQAFHAVVSGNAESDGFNRLVIGASLDWRDVTILRAAAKYLRQAGFAFSQDYVETALARNPDIAGLLVELFQTRNDPELTEDREAQAEIIRHRIDAALNDVPSLDDDRIIRRLRNILDNVLRTNFFQRDGKDQPKRYFAMKLDSQKLDELPAPRPHVEIFVYSPEVEGVHLRFGKVARGGIRWSDRREDFRTEVLSLVKAQQVKNAVIVPVGAKGGFYPKQLPANAAREDVQAAGIAAYKTFIGALLDLTDNIAADGSIVSPAQVVRHDEDDPYLVVAADKGTATFSDIANGIAESRGFWLGDAFASGGSHGYDHKKMGITARGAWEAVKRHFREMGRDIQNEPFTVIGVGDMSGDVFGNGMLLSKCTKLLAAFDHRHIFLDPSPDPEKSWTERKRVFDLPRSSWADYDKNLISKGGGIFPRSAKEIAISPEVKTITGLTADKATPGELMKALLKADIDLLWFGGIGTFIKSSPQSNPDAGDRTNDAVRVDGRDVRAKVIGEGANLGVTQLGRVEYALHGGRINTDAIDNSAGVDTSDHEVNLKILFSGPMRRGEITQRKRDDMLTAMTDDVAAHVLQDNYDQTLVLSAAQSRGVQDLDSLARFVRDLERRGRLDRAVEFLPSDEELRKRGSDGKSLTRPELAVLLAYAKLDLADEVLASDLPDDPHFVTELVSYFPPSAAKTLRGEMEKHRLRREIITDVLVNRIVNLSGPVFVHRMKEMSSAPATRVSRAFVVADGAFGLSALKTRIDALDGKVAAALQIGMYADVAELLRRLGLWFLVNVPSTADLAETIARYRGGVEVLRGTFNSLVSPYEAHDTEVRIGELTKAGVPLDTAEDVAVLPLLGAAPEIAQLAFTRKLDIDLVAGAYFAIGAIVGLDRLRGLASRINASEHWDRLAIRRIVDDLFAGQRALTAQVLAPFEGDKTDRSRGDGADAAKQWAKAHHDALDRTRSFLNELERTGDLSIAKLTLANSQIHELAAH